MAILGVGRERRVDDVVRQCIHERGQFRDALAREVSKLSRKSPLKPMKKALTVCNIAAAK